MAEGGPWWTLIYTFTEKVKKYVYKGGKFLGGMDHPSLGTGPDKTFVFGTIFVIKKHATFAKLI